VDEALPISVSYGEMVGDILPLAIRERDYLDCTLGLAFLESPRYPAGYPAPHTFPLTQLQR
jgi:hypothetical protein